MTFIVYAIDNHRDQTIYATKGAATRKLNVLNRQAYAQAIKRVAHEIESVAVFQKMIDEGDASASARHYLDEHKAALTAAMKIVNGEPAYRSTTVEDFRENVRFKVTVRNLMSGKDVEEYSDTPYYMSVASETYWSR